MANKVLIAFLVFDGIFLLTGALIIVVSIVFRPGMMSVTVGTDVGTRLLIQNTPLTGTYLHPPLFLVTDFNPKPHSWHCQCHPDLHHLRNLHSGRHPFSKSYYAQDNVMARHRLRNIQPGSWPRYMVLDTEHACQLWGALGTAKCNGAELATTTGELAQLLQVRPRRTDRVIVQLLWMVEQHQSSFRNRQCLSVCRCSCPATAMCCAVLVVCQWLLKHHVYSIVWYCWYDLLLFWTFNSILTSAALDGVLFLSVVVVLKERAQKARYRLIDEKSGLRI